MTSSRTLSGAADAVVSNLRDQFPRAGWLYALPRLEFEGIVCVGRPDPETIAALSRHARRIAVTRSGRNGAINGVEWADLVVLLDLPSRRRAVDGAAVEELRPVVERGGFVYLEDTMDGGLGMASKEKWEGLRRLGPVQVVRLLPLWGPPQAVVPDEDLPMLCDLLRKKRAHPWSWSGVSGRVKKVLRWIPSQRWIERRRGVLVGGSASRLAGQPPEYLCRAARDSGIAIEAFRWGLSIPDAYASRKLVFHLVGPDPTSPRYVAKLVSQPAFNSRLENETSALRRLEEMGLADGRRIPRAHFAGRHAGLALVGESWIEGVPFREKSDGGAGCPYAEAAVETLLDLGRVSHRRGTTGVDIARELERLLERFQEIYAAPDQVAFMKRQVAAIARSGASAPRVFQHGDPGSWNFLATAAGVALLDWEAAEAEGMPLWDLLYFLRSYGTLRARGRGVERARQALRAVFFDDSALARWSRSTIERHCREIDLDASLIEPIFHTCWMHRAVKEASRLRPGERARGQYLNLLQLGIEESARSPWR